MEKDKKNDDKNIKLDIEEVAFIVNDLKKRGLLGHKIVGKIENKTYNLKNNNWCYFVDILNLNDNLTNMINPLNGNKMTVTIYSEKDIYDCGDLISCEYFLQTSNEHLDKLIKANSETVKKLPKSEEIRDLYGEVFDKYLNLTFSDNKSLIPIIADRFSLLYPKILDEVNEKEKEKILSLEERKRNLENGIKNLENKEKNLIEGSQKKLNQLKKNYEELNLKIKKINISIKEKQEEKLNLNKKLENLFDEFESKKKELDLKIKKIEDLIKEKENEKNFLENNIENLYNLKQNLKKQFAFNFELDDSLIKDNNLISLNKETDIKKISSTIRSLLYHYENENLIYTYDVINKFYKALISDQLVLLSGPSGTGKSSLVNQIGKIVNEFKVYNISVQSNWTDVQDLLGFFNPIDKKYISTPFLDALVEANLDQSKIYIICLDEMNLAHMEYYFSTLLSVREKNIDDRYIELYSKRIYYNCKNEMLKLLKVSEQEFEELSLENIESKINKLKNHDREIALNNFDLLYYYPAKFKIPSNVRFVGTLNMDETVKPLSPKVIDRSFIIEIKHIEDYKRNKEELEKNEITNILSIDINEFLKYAQKEVLISPEVELFMNKIENIMDGMEIIPNVIINGRARRQIKEYINIELYKDKYISNQIDEFILNQVIESKILPRIQFNKSDNKKMDIYIKFINKLPKLSSKEKAIEMKEKNRIVQFWG